MQHYRRLTVWRKAHQLALEVHRITQSMSGRELPGLVSQLRRSALSIPANIAEGRTRSSDRDFAKFLSVAIASSTELEYHLEFSVDAGLIGRRRFTILQDRIIEVRRMLIGLQKAVRRSQESSRERDPRNASA